MTEKGTFYYFAYGSNMLTRRLKAEDRAPSAFPIAVGYISSYRLTFNKLSIDGSGKCDVEKTGRETDRVYGVVFEINDEDRGNLDDAEGSGYERNMWIPVNTIDHGKKFNSKIYIAKSKQKQSEIKPPYHWYKAFVIAGALEHKLPISYIEWLRAFDSIEDTKKSQRTKNEAILFSDADSSLKCN